MDRYKKCTRPYPASALFIVYCLCIGISTTASDRECKQNAAIYASLFGALAKLEAFLDMFLGQATTTAAPEQHKSNKKNNVPKEPNDPFIKPERPEPSFTKPARGVQRFEHEFDNTSKRHRRSSLMETPLPRQHHQNTITTLALSPDSSTLISGGEDNVVKLMNLATKECIATFNDHTGRILYVRFFSSGNTFASLSEDGTIKLRDKESGKITRTYDRFTFKARSEKSGKVIDVATPFNFVNQNAIAWHPKVPVLAIGGMDGYLTLIDLNTAERISYTHAHLDEVTAVSWSLDGTMLATGSWNEPLVVWDVSKMENPTSYAQCNTNAKLVSLLRFSPNGKRLASVSGTNISILDVSTKTSPKLHKTLTHHKYLVSSLDWHPDDVHIASASIDKHIAVTNTTDGSTTQLNPIIKHQARTVKWSHCGKALFVGFSNGGLETPPLPAQKPTESKSNK